MSTKNLKTPLPSSPVEMFKFATSVTPTAECWKLPEFDTYGQYETDYDSEIYEETPSLSGFA